MRNYAVKDEIYGKELKEYCEELVGRGVIEYDQAQLIYAMSIDWPEWIYLSDD